MLGHKCLLWVGHSGEDPGDEMRPYRPRLFLNRCKELGLHAEMLSFRPSEDENRGFADYHDIPDAARECLLFAVQAWLFHRRRHLQRQ